ncbi:hypothetical protein SRRS_17950 [Sporomusa rhizae]|uniref:DUF6010 family protein n=1 Tax=Sporomusa rhizae TaxID=357999 RepID=UPI00352B5404
MGVHIVPELETLNFIMPIVIAFISIFIVSLMPEPSRQRFNAILVAGAGAAYLSGGLGIWEFAFTTVATAAAYKGLSSYRYIGIAWLLHTFWDIMHHLYGNPIITFAPTSSFGCAITDAVVAIWFFFGAPSIYEVICKKGTNTV